MKKSYRMFPLNEVQWSAVKDFCKDMFNVDIPEQPLNLHVFTAKMSQTMFFNYRKFVDKLPRKRAIKMFDLLAQKLGIGILVVNNEMHFIGTEEFEESRYDFISYFKFKKELEARKGLEEGYAKHIEQMKSKPQEVDEILPVSSVDDPKETVIEGSGKEVEEYQDAEQASPSFLDH